MALVFAGDRTHDRLAWNCVGMISAGSGIPNNSGRCDLPGARATGWSRHWVIISSAFALLPCLLQGCGNSDTKALAKRDPAMPSPASSKGDILVPSAFRTAEAPQPTVRDTFADRYAVDLFSDRYAPAYGGPKTARGTTGGRTATLASGSYKVASLSPDIPYVPAIKQAHTQLIGFQNSAFPYSGTNPHTGKALYADDGRYSDNHVLIHVPAGFDVRKRGVIVMFLHGHGATLSRDVRDRQLLPAQISESGMNAVLVAPQLAHDAADSSAGKFWERDGLKRFMVEAADHLARLYGDPGTREAFAKMPVVIVAYSGGFETAAWSLDVGGLGNRVTGVVLLDAIYGEMDKFSSWIVKNRSAFFVSAYTRHNKHRDDTFAKLLRAKGIPVQDELNGSLKPGTVALLSTEGITHRDFVTLAWTQHPVTDVLLRIAQR